VDREVPMLARLFEERLRGHRAIGYEREETGERDVPGGLDPS
jgi:hypothetical protein